MLVVETDAGVTSAKRVCLSRATEVPGLLLGLKATKKRKMKKEEYVWVEL